MGVLRRKGFKGAREDICAGRDSALYRVKVIFNGGFAFVVAGGWPVILI